MVSHPYSICIYCGSRDGIHQDYGQAAEALGQAIAAEQWQLVYGAGDVGLMGRTARAAQQAGGDTFGVIPSAGGGTGQTGPDTLRGHRNHA